MALQPYRFCLRSLFILPLISQSYCNETSSSEQVHVTFSDGLQAFASVSCHLFLSVFLLSVFPPSLSVTGCVHSSSHALNITTLPGCDVNSPDTSRIPAVVEAAKGADVVALFLGLDGSIENEGQDRPIDVVRLSPSALSVLRPCPSLCL